ncbi:MAG: hypothetical protein ABS46_16490 [Cytophagaceae bacterium SCN 52-12]|nr:MAG: hypothetical protein ABS46_16490 [Cytophagaceae bacterium SCN 52-12]
MDNSSTRKNILKKIREALTAPSVRLLPESSDGLFYRKDDRSLLDRFCTEFAAIDGKLEVCREKDDFHKKLSEIRNENGWQHLYCSTASFRTDFGLDALPFTGGEVPESASAVITGCECLVARTGTIVLSSAQEYGRALTVYTPVHIVVASADQLVEDIGDGISKIVRRYGRKLPSALFFASGPSRTGDIEKTLVKGVHGPVQVYLFLFAANGDYVTDQPGYQSKIIEL